MSHYSKKEKKFYCGVDLHKKNTFLYIIGVDGEKVESKEVATRREILKKFFSSFPAHELLAAVEISSLTFWFCGVLKEMGIETYVVNTLENHYISHSMKKTDKEDARKLAIQLWKDMLPPRVYIPHKDERDIRGLISHRHGLVKSLTRIINRTSHILANYDLKFSRRVLTSSRRWQYLFECFQTGTHPINSTSEEENIVEIGDVLVTEFTINYDQFKLLQAQITQVEKSILSKLEETPRLHTMYRNLLTIPGMGPITSSALIGCVGDIKRFKSGRQLVSYLGLCPKVRESGGKSLSSKGGITKRGNSRLRGYFTQAAIGVLGSLHADAKPLKVWYDRLRHQKGWRTARIALARKLATVAFGVLKTNKPYDPAKVIGKVGSRQKNHDSKPVKSLRRKTG